MLTEPAAPSSSQRRVAHHLGDHMLSLLDAVADGVTVQDTAGHLVHANVAAAKLLGFAHPKDLLETDTPTLFAKLELFDDRGASISMDDLPGGRVLAGEDVPEKLVRLRVRESGEERWALVRSQPMRGPSGERWAVNTFRDVTETIETQRTLRERENRYAQILDSVSDMVFTKSRDYVVTYANRAACEYYGMTADQLRGITDVPHNERDFTDRYLADDRKVIETGATIEQREEPNLRHDGERRLFHTIKSPIRNTEGAVVELVGVARDITDQRAIEHDAQESVRRLELALAAGQMGVFEWNIAENRVNWSPAIERMHGIPVGSFDGSFEAYQRDIHPEDREHVFAAVRRTLDRRHNHYVSYRIIRPDGQVRWLEAHGRLVVENGEPSRLIGVCRDITDQRESETIRSRALAAEAAQREAEKARAQLAEILDAITDPFSVLDRDLRVVHLNEPAARLFGTTPADLVGKLLDEIVPGATETSFGRTYRQALQTGKSTTVEDYYAPFDRWYEASVYPLDNGIAVYTRDVTMRKRALELTTRLARHTSLRAEISTSLAEERDIANMLLRVCEVLVDNLDVAFARIWTIDEARSTLLLQASAGMYTHTDGPHAKVPVGKFKIGRIAATRQPHLTNDVANDTQIGDPAWAAREKLVAFAGYPMLVDGEIVGVMAMFSRERIPEDTMSALAGIADLVAQGLVRRRTEIELQQRLEELARSNAELEQFAYVASHDLQEPLRMVASYNQLLARRYKGKLGEDADEFIGFTVEGVTRMQRLINDLLAYSRVGTRGGERVDVDMEKVLGYTLQNLERAIADTGAEITHDPLPHVVADEGQMLQLLQNLVGNAIKFHGDAPPRVHIGVKGASNGVTFSIRDNGIGIDPQYFERIFVIFQRLNPREKFPGTGIGLAICKKIVERHGGRIWVESTPGEGSTVLFTIPHSLRRA